MGVDEEEDRNPEIVIVFPKNGLKNLLQIWNSFGWVAISLDMVVMVMLIWAL